jgi:hypothetical protein
MTKAVATVCLDKLNSGEAPKQRVNLRDIIILGYYVRFLLSKLSSTNLSHNFSLCKNNCIIHASFNQK